MLPFPTGTEYLHSRARSNDDDPGAVTSDARELAAAARYELTDAGVAALADAGSEDAMAMGQTLVVGYIIIAVTIFALSEVVERWRARRRRASMLALPPVSRSTAPPVSSIYTQPARNRGMTTTCRRFASLAA